MCYVGLALKMLQKRQLEQNVVARGCGDLAWDRDT